MIRAVANSHGFTPWPVFKYLLPAAVLLSAAMAVISAFDKHPDEKHHFLAAQYYISRYLPPEIGDPSVRESYSFYGVSYLNYHWIEYFSAGKFAAALTMLGVDELIAVRLFNVSLFAMLAGYFIYRARERAELLIFAVVLLTSAQIWYVFSYVNNDGFALFISLIAAFQVAYENSAFNRYMDGRERGSAGAILFGLLLGTLLILKANYIPFILFLAVWLIYHRPPLQRTGPFVRAGIARKYGLIVMIAIVILGARVGMDLWVNGETNFVGVAYTNYFLGDFELKKNKLLAYQEEVAEYPFKPSTLENDLANSDPPMKLKAKGFSYTQIFTYWRWHEFAIRSSFGAYDYLKIYASDGYYAAALLTALGFLGFLVASAIYSRDTDAITKLAMLLGCGGLTVFISTYLSWTYALQGQGRYFFPILPMLAAFLYSNRRLFSGVAVNGFITVMFLLAAYSFIFVGLARIER